MDASPLAQLNNRQQPPFVISPDEISPLWEASQQRQPIRPNPLQRGPFARSYSSSFGSFSSGSSNSIYTNTTSASSSGTGYFDMHSRSNCDLLSPMASLTADMSANFSLDPSTSPRLPTPRRSLLPSLSFGSQFGGGRQTLRPTTPDEQHTSSSIDTNSSPHSPLPHKLPAGQPLAALSTTALQNITNRANCPMRPPLNRFKAQSFCTISGKTAYSGLSQTSSDMGTPVFKKSSLYQFQIANGQPSDAMQVDDKENMNSTEASLDELFAVASPPPSVAINRHPTFRALHASSHSMDSSSPRSASGSEIDSPLCGNRFTSRFRPKPKVRRTLSMFQKPGDLLDTEMEETSNYTPPQLPCREFMKTDECQILPCFGIKDDMLKRIDHMTLLDVLDGQYAHLYDEHLIVDCRFPYEYEGGHIAGAVNVNTWDALESFFLDQPTQDKKVVIFHCEYSAHRAPRLFILFPNINLLYRALHLRNRDRHLNMHQYPKLYYPEIYILQGGYSGFFQHYKERCEPQSYVAMQDERHKAACAREMRNFGRNVNKLSRTQSFTYGITTTTTTTAAPGDQQDEDETMNTEDDTFEGIESRVSAGINSGVRRPSNFKSFFPSRRAVSY